MRRLFKWLFRLVILLVVLVVVLLLSLDSIIKALAERRIRSQTGMDVKIGKMSVGLLSPVVTIEDFKLYNTAEFGGSPFIDIKELHIEYDRDAFAREKLHIKLMRFNLAEVDIVRNELGRTNIYTVLGGKGPSEKIQGRLNQQLRRIKFDGIEVLNLTVGKMKYVDLKDPRQNQERNFGIKNQVFKNIKTEDDLYGVLILIWLRSGFGGGGILGVQNDLPESGSQIASLRFSP